MALSTEKQESTAQAPPSGIETEFEAPSTRDKVPKYEFTTLDA